MTAHDTPFFDDSDSDTEDEAFQDALEWQPPKETINLFKLWDDTALSDTSSVILETTDEERSETSSPLHSQRSSLTTRTSTSTTLTHLTINKRQNRLLYTRASQSTPVLPTRGTIKAMNKRGLTFPLVEESNMDLDADLCEVQKALNLFLNSQIIEAEDLVLIKSKTSLYHSLGWAFICYLKSLMTFEPKDIELAIDALKVTVHIASALRKKDSLIGSIMRRTVGVQSLKSMTRIQRHAELVYAEAYLLKAVLSIFYDNSYVSFVREGLNIRNSYLTYRNLAKFLEHVREEEEISSEEVDSHLGSGVMLGVGLFNLMLSLLPPKILKFVQFVGFSADRVAALRILEACGGWSHGPNSAGTYGADGLRRPFCDVALLTYHLVISSLVPIPDVDIPFAGQVLDFNLKRYPKGVLFLYFSGRLNQAESYVQEAITQYKSAISIQKQWKQLHHICYWEMGLNYQCLMDFENAYTLFKTLCKESMWSKCIYLYQQAVSLYTIGKQEDMDRVVKMMKKVPKLTQRIAGKSIPLEKFVARKARKFIEQNHTLLLPACEMTYVWNSYDVMPLVHLLRSLSAIELTIGSFDPSDTVKISLHVNYWDDVCLAHMLRGVVLSKIAFPNNPNHEDEKGFKHNSESSVSTCATAIASFQFVLSNGSKIRLDHYLLPFARYELGRLYTNMRDFSKARMEFQKVLDGVDRPNRGKGRYSLENMLLLRTYNAMVKLEALERDLDWDRSNGTNSEIDSDEMHSYSVYNGIHANGNHDRLI